MVRRIFSKQSLLFAVVFLSILVVDFLIFVGLFMKVLPEGVRLTVLNNVFLSIVILLWLILIIPSALAYFIAFRWYGGRISDLQPTHSVWQGIIAAVVATLLLGGLVGGAYWFITPRGGFAPYSLQSLTEVTPSAQPTSGDEKPTSMPTLSTRSPTPTSTPKPTSTTKKNTCGVNVIYGKLGGGASDPLLVTLAYSFTGQNNTYMTGAQWDFDGDGSWDTDLKQSNGTVEHTYGGAGTYKVRLQLQASDGSMTDVCTDNITVPSGITVRVTGRIYADANCNNFPDPSEAGVAGAPVRISKLPEYSIYAEVTTDGSGNFNFSQNIQPNDSLSLGVNTGVVPYGYKSNPNFNEPSYALGGSQTSVNLDIPIVPVDSIGACSF